MAARKYKVNHPKRTREKISTSQLVNRLQDHVFGKVKMTATQVRAAEIVLKKSLPDLSAVATTDADTDTGQQILGWDNDSADDHKNSLPAAPVISIVPLKD